MTAAEIAALSSDHYAAYVERRQAAHDAYVAACNEADRVWCEQVEELNRMREQLGCARAVEQSAPI